MAVTNVERDEFPVHGKKMLTNHYALFVIVAMRVPSIEVRVAG